MKRYDDVVRHLVLDYMKQHNRRPSTLRMARSTSSDWWGADLDEQAATVVIEGCVIHVGLDDSMPEGEVEVV